MGSLFVPLPELITLVLAVGIALAIWAAMRYTDLGKALRAMAEDAPAPVPQRAGGEGLSCDGAGFAGQDHALRCEAGTDALQGGPPSLRDCVNEAHLIRPARRMVGAVDPAQARKDQAAAQVRGQRD